jgi:hypothetical protein
MSKREDGQVVEAPGRGAWTYERIDLGHGAGRGSPS